MLYLILGDSFNTVYFDICTKSGWTAMESTGSGEVKPSSFVTPLAGTRQKQLMGAPASRKYINIQMLNVITTLPCLHVLLRWARARQ